MKRFLVIVLLCLLSAVLRGATPAFTSFIGSNAVTVVSNPVTGKIVFSAPTAGQSSFGASNFFTTNCIVTANGDTNRIVASGFGTAQANGTYQVNTSVANGVFTNVADRTIAIFNNSGDGQITNASGVLYEAIGGWPAAPYTPWDVVLGSAPGGGTVYDNHTNCISYAYGLEPRTNVIYINCGDSNVFLKISNAPNNSVIFVGPCSTGYVYTSWAYSSNAWAVPLALVNKTNIQIQGYGMPRFIVTNQPFADGMHISNCSRIVIDGIAWQNVRPTNGGTPNGNLMPNFFAGLQAAAVRYFATEHLLIQNCEIRDWWNHGILDNAVNGGHVGHSTNDIVLRNNYAYNIGSFHPTPAVYDGVAFGPCAGLVEGNLIEDCAFGVEPFAQGTNPFVFYVKIRNNRIRNPVHEGIRVAGSTNMFNAEIDGNEIWYDPGYTRGASNFTGDNAAINWNVGAGVQMRNNRILNPPGYGIFCYGGGAPTLGDVLIEGNLILNLTNKATGLGGHPILLGGTTAPRRVIIRNNEIRVCTYEGIRLQVVDNVVLEGNLIENANTLSTANFGAIWIGSFDSACSNILARNNVIRDTFATPRSAFGIRVGETTGAGLRKIWLLNNRIEGMGTALIQNNAKFETMVDGTWPLGATNMAAFVAAGKFTNDVWHRVVGVPNGAARTNVLPNAALTNYWTWPLTVYDAGFTATGTNVVVLTQGGQTINGGPGQTNISTDGGSMTLVPDSTGNWRIQAAHP